MPQITALCTSGDVIPVLVDNDGKLYTVLVDAATELSANIYGLQQDTDTWHPLLVDDSTQGLVSITAPHSNIHKGKTFTCDWYVASVSAGGSACLIVETPNTTAWAHLIYEIETQQEANFDLYEDATYAASGTEVLIFNKNRNSLNTSAVFVHHTPSGCDISGATRIRQRHWGSGRAGGTERNAFEIILKQGTKYAFHLTNVSAQAAWAEYYLTWYDQVNL